MASGLALEWKLSNTALWWLGAVVLGYLLVLLAGPCRRALGRGALVLLRYPIAWRLPAAFFVSYALWLAALDLFFQQAGVGSGAFVWWRIAPLPDPPWSPFFRTSILPAIEGTAGLALNSFVTYPLSALAALLVLGNWRDALGNLRRGLVRRFGWRGRIAHVALLFILLAAVLKPMAYALLARPMGWPPLLLLRVALGNDAVSFFFETLLGAGLQTYLLLLASLWVRGKNFSQGGLVGLAVRRYVVTLPWVLTFATLGVLFLKIPHFLLAYETTSEWLLQHWIGSIDRWLVRPILTALLFSGFGIQSILVLHGGTVRSAWRDSLYFARAHGFSTLVFLSLAFFHFMLLAAADRFAAEIFGNFTLPAIVWSLAHALAVGVVSGWLVASWVCFFEERRPVKVNRKGAEQLPLDLQT